METDNNFFRLENIKEQLFSREHLPRNILILLACGFVISASFYGVKESIKEQKKLQAKQEKIEADKAKDEAMLSGGPTVKEWVDNQYKQLRMDSAQLANGKAFVATDNTGSLEMLFMIKSLNEIIDDEYYKNNMTMYPDFYKKKDVARLLDNNHKMAKKTISIQMPNYRKKYVKLAADKLWENDIKVKGSGTQIWFIGSLFAANKNIKDFHQGIVSTLHDYGFKRACYKWVDADVEYTYYDID